MSGLWLHFHFGTVSSSWQLHDPFWAVSDTMLYLNFDLDLFIFRILNDRECFQCILFWIQNNQKIDTRPVTMLYGDVWFNHNNAKKDWFPHLNYILCSCFFCILCSFILTILYVLCNYTVLMLQWLWHLMALAVRPHLGLRAASGRHMSLLLLYCFFFLIWVKYNFYLSSFRMTVPQNRSTPRDIHYFL